MRENNNKRRPEPGGYCYCAGAASSWRKKLLLCSVLMKSSKKLYRRACNVFGLEIGKHSGLGVFLQKLLEPSMPIAHPSPSMYGDSAQISLSSDKRPLFSNKAQNTLDTSLQHPIILCTYSVCIVPRNLASGRTDAAPDTQDHQDARHELFNIASFGQLSLVHVYDDSP